MFKQLMIIGLISTTLLSSSGAFATTCDEALGACRSYVTDLENLEAADALKLSVTIKERDEAYKQLKSDEDRLDWYWYAALGFVLGGVGVKLITK